MIEKIEELSDDELSYGEDVETSIFQKQQEMIRKLNKVIGRVNLIKCGGKDESKENKGVDP